MRGKREKEFALFKTNWSCMNEMKVGVESKLDPFTLNALKMVLHTTALATDCLKTHTCIFFVSAKKCCGI